MIKQIKDKKQKEKIERILNKLMEEKIINEYCMDIWKSGYIIKRNDYIMNKFNEIGIESYPLRKCESPDSDCDNFYLTEEDEKNQELCSSGECIFEDTYIKIPIKNENIVIDEIFNKLGDE